jgi:hypothetical protein
MSLKLAGLFCIAMFITVPVIDSHAGQTASEWTSANPDAAYRVYKQVTAKFIAPAPVEPPKWIQVRPDCLSPIIGLPPHDEMQRSFAKLADEVLTLERNLKWYPDTIWRSELLDYEKTQIELINTDRSDAVWIKREQSSEIFHWSLELKIGAYHKEHPERPRVRPSGSCFPSEPPYLTVKTDASTIRYISVQAYEFCRERHIQLDFENCDEWTNYAFSPTRVGWGRVHLYLSWTDGFSKEMTIDVSSLARDNLSQIELEVKR